VRRRRRVDDEFIDSDPADREYAGNQQYPSQSACQFDRRFFHMLSPDIVAERAQAALANFPPQLFEALEFVGAVAAALAMHAHPLLLLLRQLTVDVA
jgi:hypothetical protein